MSKIPAICDNCSRVFNSGFSANNSRVTMIGSKSGPCPYCGSVGSVPDGTYHIVNNVIDYFIDKNYTVYEMETIISKMKSAVTIEQKEEVVDEYGLKDLLPQNRNEARTDIKFIITSIIAVLSIMIPIYINENSNKPSHDITTDKVLEYIINNQNSEQNEENKGNEDGTTIDNPSSGQSN